MAHRAPKDATAKDKVLARLRSIEGHVRSISEMVEADAYCIDVLQQTTAVRSALARVESVLLDRHLHHCVGKAIQSRDATERERVLGELLEVFDATRR
jgi:DNA-binding FrmR family transcriptional regulator